MKIYHKFLSVVLFFLLFFSLSLPIYAEYSGGGGSFGKTLSGTWLLNEEIILFESSSNAYINFSSGDLSSCYDLEFLSSNNKICYIDEELGNVCVYDGSGWISDVYRYVDFGNTPQVVSEVFYNQFTSIAKQVIIEPSKVFDDLSKDANFDINNYPHKKGDYSLEVIQLAEGELGELYIYVYQPGDAIKDYEAKYINMSIQNPASKSLQNVLYKLTLLNSYGTLHKYLVNDYRVSGEADRYYNISSIYRPFDDSIDASYEAVDSTKCVGYKVGQCWRTYYYNDIVNYEAKKIDVVEVTIQASGSVRYSEGFKFYDDACDSHYVAFSIDNYDVDKIFDADITYTLKEYHYSDNHINGVSNRELVSEEFVECEYLSSKETGSNDGDGWLGKKYTWNRIQDVSTFINEAQNDANKKFSESELTGLNNSEFVFRFVETEYTNVDTSSVSSSHYTISENIGILRLHFVSNSKYYNLGVVSNLVNIDSTPDLEISPEDNVKNAFEDLDAYLEDFFKFLCMVILVIIIIVCIIFFKPIWTMVLRGVTEICELIWSFITLPFQLIASAFKSKRK